MGKHNGKGPLGRPRRIWWDSIKINFQEVGWGMDWIGLAQNRNSLQVLVNVVMNLRVS